MKKSLYWILAIIITLSAAYYQRKTGPTYPKSIEITVNGTAYSVKLVRSIEIGSGTAVKLGIKDTTISAAIFYKRFKTDDQYTPVQFRYEKRPVDSFIMNKIFGIYNEEGWFATLPEQPPAGKLQYWFEINDRSGRSEYLENNPIVIRYKGAVPPGILTPHILFMFAAMLLSTLTGLMALGRNRSYRKYGIMTWILLLAGGMVLGPMVQYNAFGEYWTGVPLGWDLTDNKTLIAVIFWTIAVGMNLKRERRGYTILAAIVLLLIYSIPHSMFGSELDYSSGEVVQGIILSPFMYH
ncbi:MAG: hypothetical protein LC649_03205 [Bacteroidales bacterium]|nr:hypothetical protein [Bacteroidales bacterium]